MKFVLFVEGHTERLALPAFLKRWLDPRLSARVGMTPVRFDGWQNYVRDIAKKVDLNLSGRSGAGVIAGIGLLDLYGPTFYPSDVTQANARRVWAKKHIETVVGHPRFHQHFAVHELEAWLLAAPALLPADVAKALPGKSEHPESVNFDEPPAKLLERLYRAKLKRSYRKLVDGADLFRQLDPEVAAARCPQLRALLDDLLGLAKAAGL